MLSPDAAQLAAYDRAAANLRTLIRGERRDSNPESRRRRAQAKLARARSLLAALGNPHLSFPVVHVTGTSGKGSTAAAIAAVLTAAGYRVGLRTGPYIQVPTENLRIGHALISGLELDATASHVLEVGEKLFPSIEHAARLGYAETWIGLTSAFFASRGVDIAVIEVGAGGRFDASNVVKPLVSVITSVGLDHVVSLGPTLADIAWHKAGIIKPGAAVVVGDVPDEARQPIAREAAAAGILPTWLTAVEETEFAPTALTGAFQQRNARTAIAVVEELRQQGWRISDRALCTGLLESRLPARLELMPGTESPRTWVDGAHNIDKIAAVTHEARRHAAGMPLPVIVLGLLAAKDATSIAARVAASASAIVVTEPTVLGKRSLPAAELASAVRFAAGTRDVSVEPDPICALEHAQAHARHCGTDVLATGSMYLAGQLRRRWYADADIVSQRTPWPVPIDRESGSGVA